MEHKFESIYFKADSKQKQGPQARCHSWGQKNPHAFFVAYQPSRSGLYYEYSCYRDLSAFLDTYANVPEAERCFFEQIREGQACNEYYDIDWPLGNILDSSSNTVAMLEQRVFAAFLAAPNQHAPDYVVTSEQCRVLSASNGKKVSLHIIIPAYVSENNHMHMKAFMHEFHDRRTQGQPSEDCRLH